MPAQTVGKPHDAVGNAAVQHQLARENEKRYRQERKNLHPADHLLENDGNRQVSGENRSDRCQSNRESNGYTQQ